MTRRPPIDNWPARDRELWQKGIEPGGLFGGGGAGASWSDASRFKTARGYNAWLSWLPAKELLDLKIRPADRVTRERVAAYVAEIQAKLSLYTVLCVSRNSTTRCAPWRRKRIGSGWRSSTGI
jgi:hypothetical protein